MQLDRCLSGGDLSLPAFRFQWTIDEQKFLTSTEVVRLREAARRAGHHEQLLVSIGLDAGLRVHEIAQLVLADLHLEAGRSSIHVRRGKGGKSRTVLVSRATTQDLAEALRVRRAAGEPVDPESPVLWSDRSNGPYSRRGLQKMFKTTAAAAKVASHHSIHHLRHTYAVALLVASGHNLRLVQQQLGHSSILVTEVYAHVRDQDLVAALGRLYGPAPRTRGVRRDPPEEVVGG